MGGHRGVEGVEWTGRLGLTYTHCHVWDIISGNLLYNTWSSARALWWPRWIGGGLEGVSRGGTCVYMKPIQVTVQLKLTQLCKATLPQFKKEGIAFNSFPIQTPVNKYRRNEVNRKSPLEHPVIIAGKMDAKINEKDLWSKGIICIVSKSLLQDVNCKRKNSNLTMEKSGRHYLNQVTKVNITNNRCDNKIHIEEKYKND